MLIGNFTLVKYDDYKQQACEESRWRRLIMIRSGETLAETSATSRIVSGSNDIHQQ
jgi:hypothetical protein